MKVVQISDHIWRVRGLLPIQVWLVRDEDGLKLVDAGLPFMANGIAKAIARINHGPLVRILLTHGHPDHVGSLSQLLMEYPVPVYAHAEEIPYMEGKQLYPKRKKPMTGVPVGVVKPLPVDETGQLLGIGSLIPYHTPGHAPGHVVYYHPQDSVLIAGDLFTSKRGELRPPIARFTPDMRLAVESGSIVTEVRPRLLTMCHADDVSNPHEQYETYRNRFGQAASTLAP